MSESSLPAVVEKVPDELVAQAARQAAPVALTSLSLQARLDRFMVRALPELRYRLMRLGVPGVAGLVSLAAALVFVFVLLIPARQSIEALKAHLSQTMHFGPLPAAHTSSPQQFAGTLPSRRQVPALLGTLLTQANDAGVVLEQGKYVFTPAGANQLARYSFEFPVKADYTSIRDFVNRALTAIPALGLDKLHIERKNIGDTAVSAEVGFVIYLKGDAK
jgi:hypothetical protein